jgi:signal transduction histidine kinase
VAVRDTGPGISAADQAKLFQEFQQADNAITKKKGGTGLSQRIIEMHGAESGSSPNLAEVRDPLQEPPRDTLEVFWPAEHGVRCSKIGLVLSACLYGFNERQ